jgi:hypothetical protein
VLGRDDPAGDLGVHRAQSGNLPGPLITSEQRAQPDPDLHALPDPDPFTAPPVPEPTRLRCGRASGRTESGGSDPPAGLIVGVGIRRGVALELRPPVRGSIRQVLVDRALVGGDLIGPVLVNGAVLGGSASDTALPADSSRADSSLADLRASSAGETKNRSAPADPLASLRDREA